MSETGSSGNLAPAAAVQAVPEVTSMICPGCKAFVGRIVVPDRLNVQVHCPKCGKDFGLTVHPGGATPETPETANPPAGGWR
jgi:hypothetical protein